MSAPSSREARLSRALPELGLTPRERRDYGATVTAVNMADGSRRTIARAGTAMEGVAACVATIDSWPGDWRVLTISTVVTVHRDLYGSREELTPRAKNHARSTRIARPETAYLGKLKPPRFDLLLDYLKPPRSYRHRGKAAR